MRIIPVFLALCVGCSPGWGGDDDTFDGNGDDDAFDDDDGAGDDDTTDDDDTGTDDGANYPDEEEFFGLAVGNRWRYDELVSSDITPVTDDVLVEVRNHVSGDTLDPPWPANVGAWELKVDRLYGDDITFWYGLDGTGVLLWLGTRVHLDFFEYEDHPGDGSVVMTVGPDEEALLGSSFSAAFFLADIAPNDFSTEADTIETFMYGDGLEVEALGLLVSEDDTPVGLHYFKPMWGFLGQQVELDGASTTWTITECTVCPPGAGL